MTFNTPIFLIFVSVFSLLYVAVGNRKPWHLRLIIVASLIFYGTWNYRFVPLLLGTGLIDFYCALRIETNREAGRSGLRWLVLSITSNLCALGFFKYTNFFLDTVDAGASLFGWSLDIPHLDIILPAGISFYTFQSIAYTVDVYTKSTHARRDPTVFLSALTFFPHLVAGPIVRGANLMPQFERGPVVTRTRLYTGILLISAGLLKKTLADSIAPVADDFYTNGDEALIDAWAGALAFIAQIYGDFAGYSDIAIGLGLMFGYDFPQNFDLPYLAPNPVDFWRRWHMSLSSWLRDYVFMPLALRWRGHAFAPLVLTMLISGLWHGAGGKFLAWGLYLGLLLYVTQLLQRHRRSWFERKRWKRAIGAVITFYAVAVIGMTIFRAPSLTRAWEVIKQLHTGLIEIPTWDKTLDVTLAAVTLVLCHACDWLHLRKREQMIRPRVLLPFAFACFVITFALGTAKAFVYFAF